MAWSTGGKTTLSGTADTITVNNISDGEFLMALNHIITSGNVSVKQTFNNDTTTDNYGYRISDNGTTDVAGTAPNNYWYKSFDYDKFTVSYICNISGKEKLSINFTAEQDGTGKTVPPERREGIAKWVDTSSITRIDVFNSETGDYLTGSNLTVLNGDTTEETILGNNVQSGSRFEATDTRKIYYYSPPLPSSSNMEDSGSWSGSGSLSVANGQIQVRLGGSNAGVSKRDYGTANIDSSKWVMRFKWVQNGTQTLSSPNDMRCIIGLSSSDGSLGGNAPTYGTTTQDMVGMYLDVGHVHLVGIDNTASPSGQPTADSLLNFDTAGGGSSFTRYVEIIRNGDIFTLNIFTASDFTGTPITSTKTISNIGSLRYVGASAGWYGGGGGINADISEIEFYNGVISTTDPVWTEES